MAQTLALGLLGEVQHFSPCHAYISPSFMIQSLFYPLKLHNNVQQYKSMCMFNIFFSFL